MAQITLVLDTRRSDEIDSIFTIALALFRKSRPDLEVLIQKKTEKKDTKENNE